MEDRHVNKIRYAYNSITNFLHEPSKSTGKHIVIGFLRATSDQNMVFHKFVTYWKMWDNFVNFYKARFKHKKHRVKFLTEIWEKNFIAITQKHALGKGKGKKIAKTVKKVIAISESLKQNVIQLYYQYWELRFKIRYTIYRIDVAEGKGMDFGKENIITDLERQFIELDKILFDHERINSATKHDGSGMHTTGQKDTNKDICTEVTKPAHRNKNSWLSKTLSIPHNGPPTFRYILTHQQMMDLIVKVSHMNKKTAEKIKTLLDSGEESEY